MNPESGAPPSEVAGMFVNVTSTTATSLRVHRADVPYMSGGARQNAGTGNFSTECRIQSGASAIDRDLFCIAEIEELDLYFSELSIQFHVPPSMCEYVRYMPYHFYFLPPGTGPTLTSHQVMADGTVVDLPGGNTVNGEPVCTAYDYSSNGANPDRPNCCVGSFTKRITSFDENGTPTTSETSETWQGKAGNCLAGPGSSANWPHQRQLSNTPLYEIENVKSVGINTKLSIPAAIKTSVGGNRVSSSVWAANFYNPIDHAGSPGTVPAGEDPDRPTALKIPPTVTTASQQYFPQDSYMFHCLDAAEEIKSRIRLMIRDWNTNPIVQGGDPDFDDGTGDPDFPDQPLNDRWDWLDFEDLGVTYPGSLT